jgi:hypothetical protein
MSSDLFSSVAELHAAGLHSNVVELGAVLTGLAEHNPDLLSQAQLCQLHVYQVGESERVGDGQGFLFSQLESLK